MNKLSSLSIFFPAFNEEKNILNTINQALDIAPKISQKFEIIVIDDGSKDKTAKLIEDLLDKNNIIKLIQHPFNRGYGAALISGFYNSKYKYITYMDCDGQFDFSQIYKLIAKIHNVDIVVGFRIKRADKFIRVINGKLWNFMVSWMLNIPLKDIDCGFKLLKKNVITSIAKLESNGATISAELLVKAKKSGFKITQVGLDHHQRKFGKATGGNPLHIFRAFLDLFTILPKIRS